MTPPRFPNTAVLTSTQPRDDVYGAYDHSHFQTAGPTQHSQAPIVTGTSVLAAKFKDGVVIAADNLGTMPLAFSEVEQLCVDNVL